MTVEMKGVDSAGTALAKIRSENEVLGNAEIDGSRTSKKACKSVQRNQVPPALSFNIFIHRNSLYAHVRYYQ